MEDEQQVQCANCLRTLYWVESAVWGITGELCSDCQAASDREGYDDDI